MTAVNDNHITTAKLITSQEQREDDGTMSFGD